jgi:hypothetical protein
MTDSEWESALREFATVRRYSDRTVIRWLRLLPTDAQALLGLAQELHLGEHQLRDLWDWAEEIAERDAQSLAQVLAAEAVTAARRRHVSRNDKLKLVKGALRRVRFPQLVATEDRFTAFVGELDLPRSVQVTWPEFPEGDVLHVEIEARDAAAFRDAVARLLAATETPACAAIFDLLAEAL